MFRARFLLPALVLALAGVMGCTSTARMVQGTPDGGTVAIPSNSNFWPCYHRDEAERLMARKCPNGYEIVKEEEVVTGKQATTSESVDRSTDKAKTGPRERTTTSTVTTMKDQTEYRITFRAKTPTLAPAQTAASLPATTLAPAILQTGGLPGRPIPAGR